MNLRSPDRIVNNVELADKLCNDSSDLRATRARHVELHGNLIPHVFMGEVLARAAACILPGANAHARRAELVRIIATLDQAMAGGDRETCGVICLSFVWDAEGAPFFAALRPMLGPLLSARVRPQPAAQAKPPGSRPPRQRTPALS